MPMSDTDLKSHFDQVIDDVLRTGVPVEFERAGQRLQIAAVSPTSKLSRLVARPEVIVGDPDDLVHMDWSKECHVDLP